MKTESPFLPCGLRNRGNTCYMNTALQCIAWTKSIRSYFQDHDNFPCDENVDVLCQTQDVIRKLHQIENQGSCMKINGLFKALKASPCMTNSIPDLNDQNDLHEFLALLFDILSTSVRRLENEESQKNTSVQSHSFDSLVEGGTQISIRCTLCQRSSSRTEPFSSLMISPDEGRKGDSLDMIEMMKASFREETIKDRTCDFCHRKADGVKSQHIVKFPKVLTIMIKRYNDRGRKIRASFDMYESIDFSGSPNHPQITKSSTGDASSASYTIRSIACHTGNMHNGHYFGLGRCPLSESWIIMDDECVEMIKPGCRINSSEFYVLFYERT